jgi:DNA (cytosine-5)-methyltransferase 1
VTDRPPLTVLSCFSGAGGLDLGLEAAGFETVGLLETDDDARATLTANRARWPLLKPADVVDAGKRLRPKDVGLRARELDLLAGGPPCQPFSKAGQWAATARTGLQDPRGRAVMGMLDLLEAFRPKAMLIENVAGFLAGTVSADAAISARLAEINSKHGTEYALSWHVVDAADYGVPQHRSRVLATAFRDGHVPDGPPPATHADEHRTAWDALSRVTIADPPKAAGKWADLLPCVPEGSNYLHLTARGGGPELFGWRTRYWSFLLKLARDRPSWTLPASPGPGTGPFHWDNRPLAPVERLALQGFPPGWELAGGERDKVRLAGNATPPPLAEAAGRQIAAALGRPRPAAEDGLVLAVAKADRPAAAPRPSAGLPARYAALVGAKDAHPGTGAGPGRAPRTDEGEPPAAADVA